MLAARLDGRSESSSGSDPPAWHPQSARNELSRGRICRGSRRGHEKPRRPDTRDAGSAAAHARAQLPTAAARRFKTVWESGRYRRLEDLDDALHRATRILSTAGDCWSLAASLPVWSQTVRSGWRHQFQPAYGETDGADDLSRIQRDGADAKRRGHDEPARHFLRLEASLATRSSLYWLP